MTILHYMTQLLPGLGITLVLMIASLLVGLSLAVCMTALSISDCRWLRRAVDWLIFFIRGTPLLVQLFLIYYGVGQFAWLRHTFLWLVLREPMGCAILALSINTACYTTVLLRGAIQSVPQNEITACYALGMGKWLAFRRIIFPRAFRIALPAYSNEVIMILKATSLASTITLLDLMGKTQQIIAATYDTVTVYIAAGIWYLILNFVIVSAFSVMTKRKW